MNSKTEQHSSQKFLSAIVDALPIAVFCKSYSEKPGRFVAWNKQAESLWGLKSEDVIGKSDYDFFPKHQADNFLKMDEQVIKSCSSSFIPEEDVDSPTIGKRTVQTWKVPLNWDGEHLLGISIDISEAKKTQEDLFAQQEKAIMAQTINAMIVTYNHQINNPLGIALGVVESIKAGQTISEQQLKLVMKSLVKITDVVKRISEVAGSDKIERETYAGKLKMIKI